MKLISARETVVYLSQVAPRPWFERMLQWMVLIQELHAYSASGQVQAYTLPIAFKAHLFEKVGLVDGPEMDAAIREEYEPEFAEELIGKAAHEYIFEKPNQWDHPDDLVTIDPVYLIYATEVDWEMGIIRVDWIPSGLERDPLLFPNDELLGSEFTRPEYRAEFREVSFSGAAIELLLPNHKLSPASLIEAEPVGSRRQPWSAP